MDALLFGLTLLCLITSIAGCKSGNIETIPPTPNDVVATGYAGLVARARFRRSNSISSCAWKYTGNTVGDSDPRQLKFYDESRRCTNKTQSRIQKITCVERTLDGIKYVISELVYLPPLTADFDLEVRCNGGRTLSASLSSKKVRDCGRSLPTDIVVISISNEYNAKGNFVCSNNGRIFYANGSQPRSNQTTCLRTAEWSGQDGLQCWRAPESSIVGNLTVFEGNNLVLHCQYEKVFPSGLSYVLYFDGSGVVEDKNMSVTLLSLQAKDNNKLISCQPITPYTQAYNASGRSPSYSINVQCDGAMRGFRRRWLEVFCTFNQRFGYVMIRFCFQPEWL